MPARRSANLLGPNVRGWIQDGSKYDKAQWKPMTNSQLIFAQTMNNAFGILHIHSNAREFKLV